jgi:sulfide:quinone oxidoreductase
VKNLVIIGGGTGGTIVANSSRSRLPKDWRITVVDPARQHLYQPGLLFVPFGGHDELMRPRAATFVSGVEWDHRAVERVVSAEKRVELTSGETLSYDILVIASGSEVRPDLTQGLAGDGFGRDRFEFYTLEGARALRTGLERFQGGRLVVNVIEMPIKCPVAPLEFAFLADAYFEERGIRDKVELVYVTPLDAVFTKPIAAKTLSGLLGTKGIRAEVEFATGEVDGAKKVVRSYDGREVGYDLLVAIPTHSGAPFVERSGIGDELAFVPTDPRTLAAKRLEDVFVIGDASDVPTSKAGSVAHFQAEALVENIVHRSRGEPLEPLFDGHANCFVETGHGKALLIDFNYDVEPLPGKYPMPVVGPFSLLKEARMNHWGKRAFEWLYWHALLPGRYLPVPSQMSMTGKILPTETPSQQPAMKE